MEYMIDNLLAFIFFFSFYILGAWLFFVVTYNIIDDIPGPSVHLSRMEDYFRYNKKKIIFILSTTWMASWFFLLGCCIGGEIYNKYIVKNEENRIAAWFV